MIGPPDTLTCVLALLSPAKSLDFTSRPATRKHSEPRMLSEAAGLIEVMRGKSPDEVAELMSLSEDLAVLNAERYADFTVPHTPANARAAVLAFNGDTYQGLNAPASFAERDYTEAQKTVRILSGLYGVLRPLDLIQPYRLEMGTRLATARGANLYQWWGGRVTELLNADLAASPGPAVVINLASTEYSEVVDEDLLAAPVITPRFEEVNPDGRRQVISFCAKRARGAMAGWLVRNRVRSVRALHEFDQLDYTYDPACSTKLHPVFTRPRRPAAR